MQFAYSGADLICISGGANGNYAYEYENGEFALTAVAISGVAIWKIVAGVGTCLAGVAVVHQIS